MRLGKWQLILVLAALIACAASGVAWFVLHDLMEHEPDEVSHAFLIVHGVTALGAITAFGSLLPLHVASGYRRRRNHITGFALGFGIVLLIVSALVLYYGGEAAQGAARLTHIGVGVFAILLLPLHIVLGRFRR